MKEELTERQIRQLVYKITSSEQAKHQMEFDKAQAEMNLAEEVLAHSLTEEQRTLYNFFCEKKEKFYDIASQIYSKKRN